MLGCELGVACMYAGILCIVEAFARIYRLDTIVLKAVLVWLQAIYGQLDLGIVAFCYKFMYIDY